MGPIKDRIVSLAILVLQPRSRTWALLVGVHVHYVADITFFYTRLVICLFLSLCLRII